MSRLLEKLHDFYWHSPDPPFTISASYKISQKNLHIMRIIFFILQVIITLHSFWVAGAFLRQLKYLTIWGCLLCTLYFLIVSILGLSSTHKHHKQRKLLWKSTHILFEVTLAFQFLICIFFWGVIVPLKPSILSQDFHSLTSNILLHIATPLFIWIEAYYNYMKVYGRHAWWVVKISIVYGIVNVYVTLNHGSFYPLITWLDNITYVLSSIAMGLTLFGFYLGFKLSQRKEKNLHLISSHDQHENKTKTH